MLPITARRHVIMCQPRFVPLILDGTKKHTIRLLRKRPIWVNDVLDLRQWAGPPYRSKQIKVAEKTCSDCKAIFISGSFDIVLDGIGISDEKGMLAIRDGFENLPAMKQWFMETHSLPFEGIIIYWAE